MQVHIQTTLPISFSDFRDEIRRPQFFRYMAEPWLDLSPVAPSYWPKKWVSNEYTFAVNLFGRLKLGNQEFVFSEPGMPDGRWAFRCKSTGAWVKLWDHWIILKDAGEGQTLYRDKIRVRTGVMKPVFQFFARRYTGYHQERLRSLVASGFTYPAYPTEKSVSLHKRAGQSS